MTETMNFGAAVMVIGCRGKLTEKKARRNAIVWKGLVAQHRNVVFRSISIDGYDDDPRPIWKIDEAAEYVRMWARFAGINDQETARRLFGAAPLPAFDSVVLLAMCGAFKGTTPEWAVTRSAKLSDRIGVTITVGAGGQLTAEWDPDRPDLLGFKLNGDEMLAYRTLRDSLVQEVAERRGIKIGIVEI